MNSESDEMQDIELNIVLGESVNNPDHSSCRCKLNKESSSIKGQEDYHSRKERVMSMFKVKLSELKKTVLDLETSIQSRDSQIGLLQRENEKLLQELKRQQRTNRNIKQQLEDERFFYQKEKEHFQEEIQNHKEKCLGTTSKFHRLEFERIRSLLEDENKKLKNELIQKSQTNYNFCVKFLKMKLVKDAIKQKLDQLTKEHLQVMADMMEKLDEAREELNIIVSKKFQDPLPISKAKYLQIVKRNAHLVHENASLKLQVEQLRQSIEKINDESPNSENIRIDPKTIEKLMKRTHRLRNWKYSEIFCIEPSTERIGKRKSSIMETCRTVDQFGGAKLISKLRAENPDISMEMAVHSKSDHDKLSIGKNSLSTQSAPAILQTSAFEQYHFIDESGRFYEKNTQFRHIGTNP